ncbi:MAG: ribosomal protein S18-alanine N-acetyltransferase [Nitrospiraceae bacterium]
MKHTVIEPAILADLPDILRIEETCFSAPWTRKMFEAELQGNKFAHFLIARQSETEHGIPRIVGYLSFWVIFEELRFMNLAVIQAARRQGIAHALVAQGLAVGMSGGVSRAVLEVRASNSAACALYEGIGFRKTSIRTGYYSNPVEDAVLMEMEPVVVKLSPAVA